MRIIKGKILRHKKQKDLAPFVKFEDGFICSLLAALHMKSGVSDEPDDTDVFIKGFYGEPSGLSEPEQYGIDMLATKEYHRLLDAYQAGKTAAVQAKFLKKEILITEYET